MRKSILLLVLSLVLLLTFGINVYAQNKDAPPKMSKDEARSAITQTLATMEKLQYITDITFQEDSFKVKLRDGNISVSYLYDVFPEVMKVGDYFGVRFNVPERRAVMLSWKSEEDAKLFVDAVRALKKAD